VKIIGITAQPRRAIATQATQLPVGTQDTTAPAPARENETVR
jgi:hypothetical protein